MNFRAVLNIRALSNIRDEVQSSAEVVDSGLLSLRLDEQWDLTLSVGVFYLLLFCFDVRLSGRRQ